MLPHCPDHHGLLILLRCRAPKATPNPCPSLLLFYQTPTPGPPSPPLPGLHKPTLFPGLLHLTISSAWDLLTSGIHMVYSLECLLRCYLLVCPPILTPALHWLDSFIFLHHHQAYPRCNCLLIATFPHSPHPPATHCT